VTGHTTVLPHTHRQRTCHSTDCSVFAQKGASSIGQNAGLQLAWPTGAGTVDLLASASLSASCTPSVDADCAPYRNNCNSFILCISSTTSHGLPTNQRKQKHTHQRRQPTQTAGGCAALHAALPANAEADNKGWVCWSTQFAGGRRPPETACIQVWEVLRAVVAQIKPDYTKPSRQLLQP
jgi:hypothetical protein